MNIVPVNAAAWRWWIRAKAYAVFARVFPLMANAYQALSPKRHARRRARVLANGYRFMARRRLSGYLNELLFKVMSGQPAP